jgi:hypothetical protein
MTESLGQRLGDTQVETIRKIQQVFGDDAMRVTQIKEWLNHFEDGHMSADSDQRSRRPSASRNADVINKVHTSITKDRRLTVWEIANEVGNSIGSINKILTEDFGMQQQNVCQSCFRWNSNNSALRSRRTCWGAQTGISSS